MSDRLTRNDYNQIRAARDAHARKQLADEPDRCTGCGGEYRTSTIGCKQCMDRERRRRRRQDPVKNAHDLRIWRNAKRRRREQAKAA